MDIHFISGDKKIFLNTILKHHLYVCESWSNYHWSNFYKKRGHINTNTSKLHITLVLDKERPIGAAFSHQMFIGNDDTGVLDLHLYLKKEYQKQGIGSMMVEHHIRSLPSDQKDLSIMFNYGIRSNDNIIEHFKDKYKDILYVFKPISIPEDLKGVISNESN